MRGAVATHSQPLQANAPSLVSTCLVMHARCEPTRGTCVQSLGGIRRRVVMVRSVAFEGTAPDAMDFKSRRSPVFGQRGMVACTQPLAAEVGPRRA